MKAPKIILALFVVSLLAPAAFSAAPMADKVPEDCLFYFGWAGRSLTFDGSAMGRMLKEPEVGQVVSAVRSALSVEIGRGEDGQAALAHLWAMGSIAWQRPAAVGLFDLSMQQRVPGRPGRSPEPLPVGAVLIDLGKQQPAFADHLGKLLTLAGKELKITQATVGNVSYQTFPTPVGPCGVGFVGEVFFACIGAGAPERVVALLGGKGKPLSGNARFVAAMKEVAGEQVQLAQYVQVDRVYDVLDMVLGGRSGAATAPAEGSQFRRMVKALGGEGVSVIAAARSIVDGGIYEKSRIFSPAPHRGVLMLLTGKPLPSDALAGAPADADLLFTISLDPARLLAEAKRVAAEIEPRAAKDIDQALGMISQQLGLDVEKDLLAHMGDQWTVLSAPSLGGFLAGTVLSVQLKDAGKFAESLAKIEAFFKALLGQADAEAGPSRGRRPEIRSFQAAGAEVHYLALPSGKRLSFEAAFAPAWAVHQGRLYVGAFPQVVVAAATGTNEKPLAEAPGFAALRKRVAATPSALTYINTPALCRRLYAAPLMGWTALSAMLSREVGPAFRPEMLPALPKLEKYLSPDVSAVSADARGITIESYGSGLPPLLFGSAPAQILGLAAALPAVSVARVHAKEDVSRTQLAALGRA